jgi:hypothetical protein
MPCTCLVFAEQLGSASDGDEGLCAGSCLVYFDALPPPLEALGGKRQRKGLARAMANLASGLVERAEAEEAKGEGGSSPRASQQRLRATALFGRAVVLDPSDCG